MWRSSKTLALLERMLEDAANGSFVESDYNETQLSRLENQFRQYLTAKETEAERTREERAALKELVTDISHQTKTPLANILLYTQLLEEQCRDEELAPYVRQIKIQTEKLDFLIQALIKISRLESGMIRLRPEERALRPLLEQVLGEAAGRADAKGIRVELTVQAADFAKETGRSCCNGTDITGGRLPGEPDWEGGAMPEAGRIRARYDLQWTAEALGNLLDNAVKYSPEGSRIAVNVRPLESFVCLCVEDEGPGIPEEERAQIFQRFYRGRNALHTEGSGVGLYLTRMILERESGYVKVSSGAEGGSRFSVYLLRA